jgi:hypothetical protein
MRVRGWDNAPEANPFAWWRESNAFTLTAGFLQYRPAPSGLTCTPKSLQ